MPRTCILILFFLLTFLGFSLAQDSTGLNTPDYPGEIKVSVKVDSKKVPQNSFAKLTIEVTWSGDLDRFEIARVENPALNNLEMVGNSSSNWVGETGGVKRVIKKYEFDLKPESLGMAYIDGTFVEYIDLETTMNHKLVTNRIELEVVQPLFESGQNNILLLVLVVLVLASFSAGVLILIKRKKLKETELEAQLDSAFSVEQKYGNELKTTIDLQTTDNSAQFASISKIVRSYISEKFNVQAMGMTFSEITSELKKTSANESVISHVDEILQKCDVAKFSGLQVDKSSLERVYTLTEEILKPSDALPSNGGKHEKEKQHTNVN